MSREPTYSPERAGLPADRRETRVWPLAAETQEALAEQIAAVLGEHMHTDDELHVSYAVAQVGSRDEARPRVLREPKLVSQWFFEYSALVILRATGN